MNFLFITAGSFPNLFPHPQTRLSAFLTCSHNTMFFSFIALNMIIIISKIDAISSWTLSSLLSPPKPHVGTDPDPPCLMRASDNGSVNIYGSHVKWKPVLYLKTSTTKLLLKNTQKCSCWSKPAEELPICELNVSSKHIPRNNKHWTANTRAKSQHLGYFTCAQSVWEA